MGYRIRYTGGETKRKRSLTVADPQLAPYEYAFTKGEVVDIPAHVARGLLRQHPGDFRRVFPDDERYDEPMATDHVRRRVERRRRELVAAEPEEPANLVGPEETFGIDVLGGNVVLRSSQTTKVAVDPLNRPGVKVDVKKGETFKIAPASAIHYLTHLDFLEVVSQEPKVVSPESRKV